MNTLVRENQNNDQQQREQFAPSAAAVTETDEGYTLQMEMPGVNKEGLEILVENNELTITGRRSLAATEGILLRESRPERFRRVFGWIHRSTRAESAQGLKRVWSR